MEMLTVQKHQGAVVALCAEERESPSSAMGMKYAAVELLWRRSVPPFTPHSGVPNLQQSRAGASREGTKLMALLDALD